MKRRELLRTAVAGAGALTAADFLRYFVPAAVAVDPLKGDTLYAEHQFAAVSRSDDGGRGGRRGGRDHPRHGRVSEDL